MTDEMCTPEEMFALPLTQQVKRITAVRESLTTNLIDDQCVLAGVLQPCDKGADFLCSNTNYLWWFSAGTIFRPRSIAEIGTRYGYSLWAITQGADLLPQEAVLWAFDNDSDPTPTLDVFEASFASRGFKNVHVNRSDTQKLDALPIPYRVDLGVVDGLHSEAGVYHDLGLMMGVVKAGGIILVDDTNPGEVRRGCERFCHENGLEFAFVSTYRGMHIVRVK